MRLFPSPSDLQRRFCTQIFLRFTPKSLSVEGIVAAQLYRTSDQQLPGMSPTHQYACLYEVETEYLGKCINDMMSRANTDNMPHSFTLNYQSIHAIYFKPVTERVARDGLS